MQKRMAEIKEKYKDNPSKQQEEMLAVQKEFGNPLAGCLPLLLQMPVLFALFATLRGSPFSDINYTVNLQIFPQEQIQQVQPQAFATPPQNIFFADGVHAPISALLPAGNHLVVGEKTKVEFKTVAGKPLNALLSEYPETELVPRWKATKGEELVRLNEDGTLEALQPGEVTIQGTIPGLAANKGFLFIEALGRVGAWDPDGTIHWDIVGMVLFFGISLYINQLLSGSGPKGGNAQQETVNKITPVIFSGMFLFFPLPAGVLMYMVLGNIFQTVQTFFLSREPLPENLQKLVEIQEKEEKGREALPFEAGSSKKKEEKTQKPPAKPARSKKKEEKEAKPLPFKPDTSKKKASG